LTKFQREKILLPEKTSDEEVYERAKRVKTKKADRAKEVENTG
jgi:hypothetical protein